MSESLTELQQQRLAHHAGVFKSLPGWQQALVVEAVKRGGMTEADALQFLKAGGHQQQPVGQPLASLARRTVWLDTDGHRFTINPRFAVELEAIAEGNR